MRTRLFVFLLSIGAVGCEQSWELNSLNDTPTDTLEEVVVSPDADPVSVSNGTPNVLVSMTDPQKKYCVRNEDRTGKDKNLNSSKAEDSQKQARKVLLCKVPPGNSEAKHQILISEKAVDSHLKNGSYLGLCDSDESTSQKDRPSIDKCDKFVLCSEAQE